MLQFFWIVKTNLLKPSSPIIKSKHKHKNSSSTHKTFDLSCKIKQLIQNYFIFTQNQTLPLNNKES